MQLKHANRLHEHKDTKFFERQLLFEDQNLLPILESNRLSLRSNAEVFLCNVKSFFNLDMKNKKLPQNNSTICM